MENKTIDVEPVYFDEHASLKIDKAKKVTIPKEQMEAFEDALDPDLAFSTRIKRLIAGKTKTSKYIGTGLDILIALTPFRKPANRLRSLVKREIKDTMAQEKPKYKSKTLWTFGLLFVVGLLQQVAGVDLGLELSPDAQWVGIALAALGFVFRLISGKPVKVGKLLKKLQDN